LERTRPNTVLNRRPIRVHWAGTRDGIGGMSWTTLPWTKGRAQAQVSTLVTELGPKAKAVLLSHISFIFVEFPSLNVTGISARFMRSKS